MTNQVHAYKCILSCNKAGNKLLVTRLFPSCWQIAFALRVPSCSNKFETSCLTRLVTRLSKTRLMQYKTIPWHHCVIDSATILLQLVCIRVVRTTLWQVWYFSQACYKMSPCKLHAGHFRLIFSQYVGSNFPADFLQRIEIFAFHWLPLSGVRRQ